MPACPQTSATIKIVKLESLEDLPGDAELIRFTYSDGSVDEEVMEFDERDEIVARSGIPITYVLKKAA